MSKSDDFLCNLAQQAAHSTAERASQMACSDEEASNAAREKADSVAAEGTAAWRVAYEEALERSDEIYGRVFEQTYRSLSPGEEDEG